jgi:DNA methylase/ParB-like nuclease domain
MVFISSNNNNCNNNNLSSKIKINEEYDKLVPQISQSEYDSLKTSIKEDGLYVPIILNQYGIILDGHHRYRACQQLGIEPRTMEREFENTLLEKKFIIEINRNRRHLTPFQRIELQHDLESIESELARKRQLSKLRNVVVTASLVNEQPPLSSSTSSTTTSASSSSSSVSFGTNDSKKEGKVIDVSAKKAQVSPMTYFRGRKVIEEATTELKDKVRSGKVTINKAYSQLQKEQKRKQLLLLAKSEPAISFPEGVKLIEGDFVEYSKDIPSNSIDLIFTDPPYGEEHLHIYKSLFEVARKVLKDDGGSLIAYCGHIALPKILRYAEESGLNYWWILCLKHSGASARVYGRYMIADWKPIIFLIKGSKPNIVSDHFIHDLTESKPPDKSLNDWAQSTVEAEYLISKLTVENQIVFDPMMGTGTTGIAALKIKRQFLGIEKDVETFEDAKRNISKKTISTSD